MNLCVVYTICKKIKHSDVSDLMMALLMFFVSAALATAATLAASAALATATTLAAMFTTTLFRSTFVFLNTTNQLGFIFACAIATGATHTHAFGHFAKFFQRLITQTAHDVILTQ